MFSYCRLIQKIWRITSKKEAIASASATFRSFCSFFFLIYFILNFIVVGLFIAIFANVSPFFVCYTAAIKLENHFPDCNDCFPFSFIVYLETAQSQSHIITTRIVRCATSNYSSTLNSILWQTIAHQVYYQWASVTVYYGFYFL